jgi:hypothetical protein
MADSTHVSPLTTKQFLENIRPFCEKLAETWPGIPQRLRRRFLRELMNVLGIWFQKAHLEPAPLKEAAVSAIDLLREVRSHALVLRATIKQITEPDCWDTALSWEFSLARRFVARNLEHTGRATAPPWDLNSILAALSAIIEMADSPMTEVEMIRPHELSAMILKMKLDRLIRVPISYDYEHTDERPAGRRPFSFYQFPELDFLVLGLGAVAARAGVKASAGLPGISRNPR